MIKVTDFDDNFVSDIIQVLKELITVKMRPTFTAVHVARNGRVMLALPPSVSL